MAEAVALAVGGAALGAFLNVLLDRMAPRRFVDFITPQKRDHGLLQELKTALKSVQDVLDDAEEKEITKPDVKEWLNKLKNAFFEADDLLDEIDYEATRLEREAESRSAFDEVRKFVRRPKSFKKGLRKILKTIQDLVYQKDVFGLRKNMEGGQSTQREPTVSVVDTSNIFGRVPDKEAIMKVLLPDGVNRSNNLSIISIVGVGGIGKTTLAQLIYNDEGVRNRFGVRGWVCVSDVFDVSKITGAIAMEVAQMTCKDKTPNQFQVELTGSLTGESLLLVLDDVWIEKIEYWEQLLAPLKYGGPGSTIIITTRNDVVATNAATTVTSSSKFRLPKLDSTACWQLFCKYAFVDQNSHDYLRLEEIGKEIVQKCDGLPLAVKVIGGVLRSKKHVKYWENVARNDLWKCAVDDVLPVLRLSYRYLPSHLKQCFAYCSIFPKDYMFKKEQLILLWMAEGFLIDQEANKTMEEEDVGEEYFEELVSRSFFQRVDNSFVMHDLINDLATVVAGDFCFRSENQDSCGTFDRLRYFSCVAVKGESSSPQLSRIFKSHLLRTFLSFYNTSWELQEMIPDLFLNQQRLRVLSLSRCRNVVELPGSISRLKHLRYLDLSNTFITSLPEWLCSFYNLQTLKLRWCYRIKKLPTEMERMISMHHLDIEGVGLQEMPPNMGKLIKLQTLTNFYVGKREGCGVNELGSLRHLRGKLSIWNLQNVVNSKDALEAKIKCKENLKELHLYWPLFRVTVDPRHEEVVLDGLQPHTEIKVISIYGYGGNSFPNWLGESSFAKLVSLKLERCKYCSSLPPVGQMPSLKHLEVRRFDEVRVIDSDFYGRCVSAVKPFQSLESLYFEDMPQWQEWKPYGGEGESESGAFPCLKELRVINCPNLEGALPIHLPSLTELVIEKCPQLQNCVPNAPNISLLLLINSNFLNRHRFGWSNGLAFVNIQESVLEKIGQLGSSFEEIAVVKHEPLKSFPLELFPKLKTLRIKECPHFESFSTPKQEFVPFEFLTKLILTHCLKLKLLPERMHALLPALLTMKIKTCPEVETFSGDGLPVKLESLTICDCNKLIVGRLHWDLQNLTSLTSFSIGHYEAEEMECFPEVSLLPSTTLTCLQICDLPHLTSLNMEGLQRFDSLEKLKIINCRRLQLVPDEILPSTLTHLQISNLHNFKFNGRFHDLTCLIELRITECPKIASLPEEGLSPNLLTLELDNLQDLRSVEGLCLLTSLESLTIRGCPHLKTWPKEGLPSSLSDLEISRCPEIASLPEGLPPNLIYLKLDNLQNLRFVDGFRHLTSLENLRIWDCPLLKTLPKEGLPSSLSSLYIWGCPLLQKRCRTKKGTYSAKISHITDIYVD